MEAARQVGVQDSDDWEQLLTLLPPDWRTKCRELNALRRNRGFPSADALLRVLMIHLLEGKSLRDTAIRAREGKIAAVSDVALLKRLHACGEWFRWLALACRVQDPLQPTLPSNSRRVVLLDATHVKEPGVTGARWRIHYAFDVARLECSELKVTDESVGETFKNFSVQPGVVYMADRGYWQNQGIQFLRTRGAHALVRMGSQKRTIMDSQGHPFNLQSHLRTLKGTRVGDWAVRLSVEETFCEGRICALRKSEEAIQKARIKVKATCERKQKPLSEGALEASEYICLFTTVPAAEWPAEHVLEAYRSRWQIELCFKRLKSLLGLGHLPKQDPEGAKAWIQGKLFCALLIERFVSYAERFSPWGYPLRQYA